MSVKRFTRASAVAVMSVILLAGWAAAQTGTAIEIDQLQKRGDIYYHPTTNAPYTGSVINLCGCYECGCRGEAGMRNGKWHGNYLLLDHGSGVEGNFNDGKMHGEWKHYDDGEVTKVEIYVNGVLQNK